MSALKRVEVGANIRAMASVAVALIAVLALIAATSAVQVHKQQSLHGQVPSCADALAPPPARLTLGADGAVAVRARGAHGGLRGCCGALPPRSASGSRTRSLTACAGSRKRRVSPVRRRGSPRARAGRRAGRYLLRGPAGRHRARHAGTWTDAAAAIPRQSVILSSCACVHSVPWTPTFASRGRACAARWRLAAKRPPRCGSLPAAPSSRTRGATLVGTAFAFHWICRHASARAQRRRSTSCCRRRARTWRRCLPLDGTRWPACRDRVCARRPWRSPRAQGTCSRSAWR